MSGIEANAIIDNYNERFKTEWEQTRYIAYIQATLHTKQIKKPQDLMKFSWEDEIEKPVISKEDKQKHQYELLEWFNNNIKK